MDIKIKVARNGPLEKRPEKEGFQCPLPLGKGH
jgi:hypothetical protein